MKHPLPALSLLLSLASCASTSRAQRAAPENADQERFTYRAVVATVPPGASKLVLRVQVPGHGPAGPLHALRATGLVGNAPFEVAIPATAGAFHGPHVELSWAALDEDDRPARRELRVATHGRPVELGLCFALAASTPEKPIDLALLEQELVQGTNVEIDEQPGSTPRTSLERVR